MWAKNDRQLGFTIVELLIVIVVIGILAAITVVAFNGVQDRAMRAQVVSMADQAGKKVMVYQAGEGSYPTTLAEAGIANTADVTYDYTQTGDWFCVTAKLASNAQIASGISSQGNCSQLNVSYYHNNALSGTPVLTRTEPNIDYNWGSGSPASGVRSDSFSARWEGYITAPVTGAYTLHFWYDDLFRLYLDDTLVADYWTGGCCTWRSAPYTFTAGQKIPFKLEMAENGGGAGARLHWSYTGQAQIAIPPSAFSTS